MDQINKSTSTENQPTNIRLLCNMNTELRQKQAEIKKAFHTNSRYDTAREDLTPTTTKEM